jgi:nicotinamidase-related amidase
MEAWAGIRWWAFGGTFFLLGSATHFSGQTPREGDLIVIDARTQELAADAGGHSYWRSCAQSSELAPARTALLICDMWDRHWSRGATERVAALAPRVNQLATVLRDQGVLIVHAPSETVDFYADTPARKRISPFSTAPLGKLRQIELPPLPIDDSDGGSDTGETPWYKAWTRQHPAIAIDQERDVISDDGNQIVGFLRSRGIRQVLFTGVHTNMCVLKSRSFSLKALAELGVEVYLVRDLTDSMYNPARPPYVDHDAGTKLVIEYIEKFLCPTISSDDLVPGRGAG